MAWNISDRQSMRRQRVAISKPSRITRIYEGTSEVQRLVVARELLRGA